MGTLKKWIDEIGVKKMCLFAHYGLAIIVSLAIFTMCIICTISPQVYDVTSLLKIYVIIMIYCGIVVLYITIVSIYESMQTMNKKNSKFDFIAFFIGFSMLVTLGLIITCIVYMFMKPMDEISSRVWTFLIGIFGAMFITEAGGGYLYNGMKKKLESQFGIKKEDVHDEPSEVPVEKIEGIA